MTRRAALAGALAAGFTPRIVRAAGSAVDFEAVVRLAEERAAAAHAPAAMVLRGPFAGLSYNDYRRFETPPDRRLWAGDGRFAAEPLPPGFLYGDRVEIATVENGVAEPVSFDPARLWFGGDEIEAEAADIARSAQLGWTGFRLTHPINAPDVMDEIAVFQGASYFRAVARGLSYGLSARALAIGSGSSRGEEFPAFTRFWLHKPGPSEDTVTIHALLESDSCAGAFEFVLRPGGETTIDVRAAIRPRRDIAEIGIAPLTSMYWFADVERSRVDDHRAAVHDSDGLLALTGAGERLWRPLANHRTLEMSAFVDRNPKGFGLAQRRRAFEGFLDTEAGYHLRPSAWVEPRGDWGEGTVVLLEIPTDNEFNDNIVAFWRPMEPLAAGETRRFDYRMTWSAEPPVDARGARVVRTTTGRDVNGPSRRFFAVDFDMRERPVDGLTVEGGVTGGALVETNLIRLPGGGARATLLLEPPSQGAAEMLLKLRDADGAPASETWLYRWTPT